MTLAGFNQSINIETTTSALLREPDPEALKYRGVSLLDMSSCCLTDRRCRATNQRREASLRLLNLRAVT